MRKSALLLLSFLISFSTAAAQPHSPKQGKTVPAHVPEQIRTAKTIFISNVGGGCFPPDLTYVPRDAAVEAYGKFYDAMELWGRYRVASDPSDAELNFEIGVPCPYYGNRVWPRDNPRLRLVIRDVKTRAVLWAVMEPLPDARPRNRFTQELDQAVRSLMANLKELADARERPRH